MIAELYISQQHPKHMIFFFFIQRLVWYRKNKWQLWQRNSKRK